jgi:hypothetical protein
VSLGSGYSSFAAVHGRKLSQCRVGYPRKFGDYRARLNSHQKPSPLRASTCYPVDSDNHVLSCPFLIIYAHSHAHHPSRAEGQADLTHNHSREHRTHQAADVRRLAIPSSRACHAIIRFSRVCIKLVACQPTPNGQRGSKESRYCTRPVGVICMEILAATCVACYI